MHTAKLTYKKEIDETFRRYETAGLITFLELKTFKGLKNTY